MFRSARRAPRPSPYLDGDLCCMENKKKSHGGMIDLEQQSSVTLVLRNSADDRQTEAGDQ